MPACATTGSKVTTAIPKVWVAIPVHNRLQFTRACIRQLVNQDYEELAIVIVDDGSTDGTGQFLEQLADERIVTITGDGNLWWARAMELAINHFKSAAQRSDFLLMLNDDVTFGPDYISTLVKASQTLCRAVVGSAQREQISGRELGSGYLIDHAALSLRAVPASASFTKVDAVPARGALFPFDAVAAAGNVRPKLFPHYLADLDFSARCRAKGWLVYVVESAPVFTDGRSSDTKVRNKGAWQRYTSSRSKDNVWQRLAFFMSHGPTHARFTAPFRFPFVAIYRRLAKRHPS